jgi:predicted  nucleic acid-binding Zn-ribbon protein
MQLLDYLIKTGEKQGNSKHFKNFLKIHSHMMKIERELRTAKEMINAKNDLLIHKEQKERKLKLEVSTLNTEVQRLKKLSDEQELKIDNLMDEKINGF